MSYTFCSDEMIEDLNILAKACPPFLGQGSANRIASLARSLRSALANAESIRNADFSWKTVAGSPITIGISQNYKGTTNDFDPLIAEIEVDYRCSQIGTTKRVLVVEGVTVVRIGAEGGGTKKVFHFDAGVGGWANQAGHPPFHFQFHGMINDIPRLPTIIFHPADVVSMVILELHQSRWRQHLMEISTRSKLRRFPSRQNRRLSAVLSQMSSRLTSASDHALVALQRSMPTPLDL